MSVRELVEHLISALEHEAERHDTIRRSMVSLRTAFSALQPDELERGLPQLAAATENAVETTTRREEICDQLSERFGIRGDLTLTKLFPFVPHDLVPRLQKVADNARSVANNTRIESRVGERLLELSGRMQRSLLGARPEHDTAMIYDKQAQTRHAAPRRGSIVEGVL